MNGLIRQLKFNDAHDFTLVDVCQAHSSVINRLEKSPFTINGIYYVATGSNDKTIKIWNPFLSSSNWTLIQTFTGHTNYVKSLEWINEDTISSGSCDNTIKIWSISSGQAILSINVNSYVLSLKLLSDRIHIAAGLSWYTNNINIYNINDGSLRATLSGHKNEVNDLVLISDGLLASASRDSTVRIWNLTTFTSKFILNGHISGQVVSRLKQINSNLLASCSSDSTIKLWNITDGTLVRSLENHTSYVTNVDLLEENNGRLKGENMTIIVSSSMDKSIKIWNTANGECLSTLQTGFYLSSMVVLSQKTSIKSKNKINGNLNKITVIRDV